MSFLTHMHTLRQYEMVHERKLLKLLQHQQMERDILSRKQDSTLKALDLHDFMNRNVEDEHVTHRIKNDVKETISDKASMLQYNARNLDDALKITEERIPTDTLHENYEQEETEKSNYISVIVDNNGDSMRDYTSNILSRKKDLSSDVLIEGIKPLSMNNIVPVRPVSIEDMPLPSSEKDFETLLDEKLRKESEVANAHIDTKSKPKKPFLRKGQGLTRYKSSTPLINTRYTPLSCNTRHTNKNNKNEKYITRKDKLLQFRSDIPVANEQSNSKTVPPKKRAPVESKSISPITLEQIAHNITNQSNHQPEMNISDMDSKAEREMEEVRIFELLEEKAENSSFCSTSSTVLAFLQQSTPFKKRKEFIPTKSGDGIVVVTQQQDDERTSNTVEQEQKMVWQPAHIKNSESSVQQEFKGIDAIINTSITDCFRDTVKVQEKVQKHLTITDQISEDNETHTDHSRNHDISIITVSDSDEEKGIAVANNRDLTHDSEADVNHRVRFSKYNQYRTIVLTAGDESTSKDYFEQQNNRSVDISESSDDEERLPLNYEKFSSLKTIGSEEAIDAFLLQDTTEDSYYRVNVPEGEEESASSSKDDSPGEDACCRNEYEPISEDSDQVSDNEQSISSLASSLLLDTHRESNTYDDEKYTRDEQIKLLDQMTKIQSNVEDVDLYSSGDQANTFTSDHVKYRLLELEKEIDIFRKESSALILQRRNLQEEQTMLRKAYAEKERNFEENKKRVQNQLEEEKKKLARVKAAMENRIRDAQEKAKQNKTEKEKVQDLQIQLEKLTDELHIKESRWNAAESRYKSEIRVGRAEISKLKQEITNLQSIKKMNVKNIKKGTSKQIIRQAMNQINKNIIISPPKVSSPGISKNLPNTLSNTSIRNDDNNNDKNKNKNRSSELSKKAFNVDCDFGQIEDCASANKVESKQVEIRSPKRNQEFSDESVAKKQRYLYKRLLQDAISPDLTESEDPLYARQYTNDFHQPIITQDILNEKNDGASRKSNDKSFSVSTYEDFGPAIAGTSNAEYRVDRSPDMNQDADKENIRELNQLSSAEKKNLISSSYPFIDLRWPDEANSESIKEIKYPDGHVEYWYQNGSVKKFYPDRNFRETEYHNGDIREIDNKGKERYFYAKDRTWETTTPDGFKILEFSNGQVEKHMTDGTIEVIFPDGTVQITQPDGTGKLFSPDGTMVKIFTNGDKILFLPNGQKEIHTMNDKHKRREYPDGTVKMLYPDGMQETYYSNGRKRVKDKEGNLLIDTIIDTCSSANNLIACDQYALGVG